MAADTIYLKLDQSVEVTNASVSLKDVSKITCSNSSICNKAKTLKIFHFKKEDDDRQVISVLKIIEQLQMEFPNTEIENVGESDVVVKLVKTKGTNQKTSILKIIFVSLICFFGTAFTIMAFHNDIGIDGLFETIYEIILGKQPEGYTILELCYSIGLGIGIVVFFNHIGGRRITKDPTPIEVEMHLYEEDINTTLIKTWEREGKKIEVN